MENSAEKIDTRQQIELAEGVEVGLRVAGPMVRCLAFGIDLMIRFGIIFVFGIVASLLGLAINFETGEGFYLLVIFAVSWLYHILFEFGKKGATPGKRSMGLRVVQPSGAPITFGQSLIRNLLRAADMMPFASYGIGLVFLLFTKRFQRLGDLAANTLVVYDKPLVVGGRSVELNDHEKLTSAVMPAVALSREEESSIVSFGERLGTWSPERQEELANHVNDLTGQMGARGVNKLRMMAKWLQSER